MTTLDNMDYAELVAAVELYERINNTQSKKEHSKRVSTMTAYYDINYAIDTITQEDADCWMGD